MWLKHSKPRAIQPLRTVSLSRSASRSSSSSSTRWMLLLSANGTSTRTRRSSSWGGPAKPRVVRRWRCWWIWSGPGLADEPTALRDAIREFFTHRAQVTRSRLRQLLRIGRISLLVGLVFLVAAVGLGDFIANAMKGQRLGELLREGLVICGWVAMWRPLEIFLYGWWPIRTEAKLFDRLSAMPVRIAYEGTAEPGEEGAWRHDWPAVPPAQTTPQKSPPHAAALRSGGAKLAGTIAVPERGPIASAVVDGIAPEGGVKSDNVKS